ncbi:MAG: branched-chain amino acid ABC transporter permease [Alphaproteobacteria bacterium]|nr:branched-chain amino acid ABC transporter permease [Alphaproteobacteria bacterium]
MARSATTTADALANGSAVRTFLRRYAVWILFIAVAIVLPWLMPGGSARTVMSQIGVAIIFALAYNMLLGQGGMLSFGHAIYFGLAGFCIVHLIQAVQDEELFYIPLWIMPLIGGLVGMFFGCAVGYVSTRRAGTIFAMISLGFGEMVSAMVLVLVAFFGGEEGIQTNRAIGTDFFGLVDWTKDIHVYYLIALWAFVAVALMYAITKTPLGRISNAVRDNPERVAFVGYNTQRVRWLVFTLSGFFAGLAGALHSISFEQAGFEMVNVERSGAVLFMAYIGGAGMFAGPVIGAVLITALEKIITDVSHAWPLYLGLFFMIVVMFSPGGIAGLLGIHERIWKVDWRLLGDLVRPYLLAIGASIIGAVGAVCIVELTHALTSQETLTSELTLFGVPADAATILPWIIAFAILGLGIWLCRRTYPGAKAGYDNAIKAATDKALGQ